MYFIYLPFFQIFRFCSSNHVFFFLFNIPGKPNFWVHGNKQNECLYNLVRWIYYFCPWHKIINKKDKGFIVYAVLVSSCTVNKKKIIKNLQWIPRWFKFAMSVLSSETNWLIFRKKIDDLHIWKIYYKIT